MRFFPFTLCLIGLFGLCFAYWGLYTFQGQHAYDEMAAIFPAFIGIAGSVMLLTGAIWMLLRMRSRSR